MIPRASNARWFTLEGKSSMENADHQPSVTSSALANGEHSTCRSSNDGSSPSRPKKLWQIEIPEGFNWDTFDKRIAKDPRILKLKDARVRLDKRRLARVKRTLILSRILGTTVWRTKWERLQAYRIKIKIRERKRHLLAELVRKHNSLIPPPPPPPPDSTDDDFRNRWKIKERLIHESQSILKARENYRARLARRQEG